MGAPGRVQVRDLSPPACLALRGRHHRSRLRSAGQHTENRALGCRRRSGAGVRRLAFVVPYALVPAPGVQPQVRDRPLRRRGRRGARQGLDVEGDAPSARHFLGQGAERGGAPRAASEGAREVLHRQLGQDRSRGRALDSRKSGMSILVERKDGVGRITLNRPEVRNAFDDALIAALAKSLAELDADSSVRAVVLAGNGPAFCAGADLNWMKRMAGYSYDENLRDARGLADMLSMLARLDKPTIARVHGPAFAGGTGLVAACDIAVGTPEAKFCFSEAKLALSPATISPSVMRAIGARAGSRYFLTAEVFDAEEALRIGMLSALVTTSELDAFIDSLLKHLLAGGSAAHVRIKDLVHDVVGRPIDDELKGDTARRIAVIRASEEGKEGIASFLEKRKPKWVSGKS